MRKYSSALLGIFRTLLMWIAIPCFVAACSSGNGAEGDTSSGATPTKKVSDTGYIPPPTSSGDGGVIPGPSSQSVSSASSINSVSDPSSASSADSVPVQSSVPGSGTTGSSLSSVVSTSQSNASSSASPGPVVGSSSSLTVPSTGDTGYIPPSSSAGDGGTISESVSSTSSLANSSPSVSSSLSSVVSSSSVSDSLASTSSVSSSLASTGSVSSVGGGSSLSQISSSSSSWVHDGGSISSAAGSSDSGQVASNSSGSSAPGASSSSGSSLASCPVSAGPIEASVWLLDRNAQALDVVGNGAVDVSSSIVVDSQNPSAVSLVGNAFVQANRLDLVGGIVLNGNAQIDVGNVSYLNAPLSDPLRFVPAPDPSGMVVQSQTGLTVTHGTVHLQPGVYRGGIFVSGKAQVVLSPGIYYLAGGGLKISGQAKLSGQQAMIYNAPVSSSDGIQFTGQASVNLTAPADGPYQGLAFFQARQSSASLLMTGNENWYLQGAVYAPGASVVLAGNGDISIGSQYIAGTLSVRGNGTFRIFGAPLTGCPQ